MKTRSVYRSCFDCDFGLFFEYQGIAYTSREKVIDVGPIEPLLKSNKISRVLPSSVLSRLSVVLL